MARGQGSTQPFFGWVHLYDAHAPYDPPAPFAARFKAAPYDGEIAYVDACIGRLIAALERSGRLDRTLSPSSPTTARASASTARQEHGMFLYDERAPHPVDHAAAGARARGP